MFICEVHNMAHAGSDNKHLLFMGGGNIAGAVACGLVKAGTLPPEYVTVYDIDPLKLDKFKECGIKTTSQFPSAALNADYIFIAVKPNVVKTVIKQIVSDPGFDPRSVIVSFAAAVSIDHIIKSAERELKVIRTMPGTPILVGEGVLAACKNDPVGKSEFEYFCRILSSIAYVSVMPEDALIPVISVNGSSPAYVYLFIKSMLDASVKLGIDRDTALQLILKTVKGSVTMIEKSDVSIDQLIKNVSSPNGTTVAALESFYKDDFSGSVERAMTACTRRAEEISEEL